MFGLMTIINWTNILVVAFGLITVFVVLLLLVLLLFLQKKTAQIINKNFRKMHNNIGMGKTGDKTSMKTQRKALSVDESAAIAMAIHLYYAEIHDEENAVITIKKVEKRYSPWSSKIYSVSNLK